MQQLLETLQHYRQMCTHFEYITCRDKFTLYVSEKGLC